MCLVLNTNSIIATLQGVTGLEFQREDVKSSVRNNLGLNVPKEVVSDQRATGIATLLTDVRETFSEPLTETTLFSWHSSLMMGKKMYLLEGGEPIVNRCKLFLKPWASRKYIFKRHLLVLFQMK